MEKVKEISIKKTGTYSEKPSDSQLMLDAAMKQFKILAAQFEENGGKDPEQMVLMKTKIGKVMNQAIISAYGIQGIKMPGNDMGNSN